MTKLQLSLTSEEAAVLTSYGSQFGYNLAKITRFIISKAVEELLRMGLTPVYKMSAKTEKKGLEALKEYREGKTAEVRDVKEFFDSL